MAKNKISTDNTIDYNSALKYINGSGINIGIKDGIDIKVENGVFEATHNEVTSYKTVTLMVLDDTVSIVYNEGHVNGSYSDLKEQIFEYQITPFATTLSKVTIKRVGSSCKKFDRYVSIEQVRNIERCMFEGAISPISITRVEDVKLPSLEELTNSPLEKVPVKSKKD